MRMRMCVRGTERAAREARRGADARREGGRAAHRLCRKVQGRRAHGRPGAQRRGVEGTDRDLFALLTSSVPTPLPALLAHSLSVFVCHRPASLLKAAVEHAKVCVENEFNRQANLELLTKYGAAGWLNALDAAAAQRKRSSNRLCAFFFLSFAIPRDEELN